MRYLLIGLFCAALGLGCGGSNEPPPTPSANGANSDKADKPTVSGPKSGKPKVVPPDKPKVNLP